MLMLFVIIVHFFTIHSIQIHTKSPSCKIVPVRLGWNLQHHVKVFNVTTDQLNASLLNRCSFVLIPNFLKIC